MAEGSLGLAMGKEKRRSMLEKSGSSTVASAQLSDAHMELCSAGRACMLEGGRAGRADARASSAITGAEAVQGPAQGNSTPK